MAETFAEDFEGFSDGTALTSSNTAFSGTAGSGTLEADTAQAAEGSVSALASVDGTTFAYFRHAIGSLVGLRFWRWYWSPDSIPSSNTQIAQLLASGTVRAQVRQNSDGTFSLRNAFTAVATSTTSVSAGTAGRLQWSVDNSAGTNELQIFVGANVDGTTPDETIADSAYSEGTYDEFDVGILEATDTWSTHLDAVAEDDSAYPGPATADEDGFEEHFDTLSDGTTISASNTSFDEVLIDSPHTLVADDAWSITGSISALFTFNDASGACKTTDFVPREEVTRYIRWYTRFNSVPGTFHRVFTAEDSVNSVNNSIVTLDDEDRLRITNGQYAASTRQFAAGDEVRIEVLVDPVDETQTLRLYYTDMHAAVDSYDEELTTSLGPGTADDWEIGTFSPGGAWSMNVDAVVMRTDRWVGPESAGQTALLGTATETDTAPPVTPGHRVTIGQATETDVAPPVRTGAFGAIGLATETDTAQPVRPGHQVRLGMVFSSETARPFTAVKTVVIGLVTETDTARPVASLLAASTVVRIGVATETDMALAVTIVGGVLEQRPIEREPAPAVWRWVIGPATGGHELNLTNARNRRLTLRRTRPHKASCELDARTEAATAISELATDLHVIRDGQVLHRGRAGATTDDLDASEHRVSITAHGYRELLNRRILWSDSQVAWTQVDQAQIAWELLQQTQTRAGGDLGITRGVGVSTGVLRDRTYEAGDTIGERLQQLSEVLDGFDWDITPSGQSALQLDIFYPSRGTDRGVTLTYGSSLVQTISREVAPGDYANAVRVTGDEVGDNPPTPVEREAADLADRPEGRWDTTESTNIKQQQALNERADWLLASSQVVQPSYRVRLAARAWSGPDHIWVGDTVLMRIKSGRLQVDTPLRVEEIDISLDDQGEETVDLVVGADQVTLGEQVAQMRRTLATLPRR